MTPRVLEWCMTLIIMHLCKLYFCIVYDQIVYLLVSFPCQFITLGCQKAEQSSVPQTLVGGQVGKVIYYSITPI